MITSLGCIWYPSSLNDKFLPSKVTLIRYLLEREKSRMNINAWELNLKGEPASPSAICARVTEVHYEQLLLIWGQQRKI